MQVFTSRKRNLFPSVFIWLIFYGGIILMLAITSNSLIIPTLVALPGVWSLYKFSVWLSKAADNLRITTTASGLEVNNSSSVQTIAWKDIQEIKFFSIGGGLTILLGPLGKYLGFYRIKTEKVSIDLLPSLVDFDKLLRIIIQGVGMKKYQPTFERSVMGGTLATQMDWGSYPYWVKEENYQPSQSDLNIVVGGVSKSGIQLLFVLVIGVIFIFFLLKFLIENNIIK